MNQVQATGNGSTTDGDGPSVEQKAATPNRIPAPPATSGDSARHFPQTLVAMDPPTLPAASLSPAPAEFRQFPTPQRSVPGHPTLRSRIRRILLFWRRGA